MIELTADECRVLGVLVEKALTTPAQYPLTLNALTSGCNQKNNRYPIVSFDENRVQSALDHLRGKQMVVEVHLSSSRVVKYKQEIRAALNLQTPQVVILTELMLRGPQTTGEIRGRASRMHRIESIEVVQNVLDDLARRDPPLVHRFPPAPGSRAEQYAQLLCPDAHPLETAVKVGQAALPPAEPALHERIERIEAQLTALRNYVKTLSKKLAETGPIHTPGQDGPD